MRMFLAACAFVAAWTAATAVCPSNWPTRHVQQYNAQPGQNQVAGGKSLYELLVRDSAKSDDTYEVHLRANDEERPFRNFIVVSEAFGAKATVCGNGSFLSSNVATETSSLCPHVLTSNNREDTESAIFQWKPPTCGCVRIRATVIPETSQFFLDSEDSEEGSLTEIICTDEEEIEESEKSDGPVAENREGETTTDKKHQMKKSHMRHRDKKARIIKKREKKLAKRKARKIKKIHKKKVLKKARKIKKIHKKKVLKKALKGLKQRTVKKNLKLKGPVKRVWRNKKAKKVLKNMKKAANLDIGNVARFCASLKVLKNKRVNRKFGEKWAKQMVKEGTNSWKPGFAETKACCEKETEEEQRACFLTARSQSIDEFCWKRLNTTSNLGNGTVYGMEKRCCHMSGNERYSCFLHISEDNWINRLRNNLKKLPAKVFMRRIKQYRIAKGMSVKQPKTENGYASELCAKVRNLTSLAEEGNSKSIGTKEQHIWPLGLDLETANVCCGKEGVEEIVICMAESKRRNLDNLCKSQVQMNQSSSKNTKAVENLHGLCCLLTDEQRYKCFDRVSSTFRRNHYDQYSTHKLRGSTQETNMQTPWPRVEQEDQKADMLKFCCEAGRTIAQKFTRRTRMKFRRNKCTRKAGKFALSEHPAQKKECQHAFQRCCM